MAQWRCEVREQTEKKKKIVVEKCDDEEKLIDTSDEWAASESRTKDKIHDNNFRHRVWENDDDVEWEARQRWKAKKIWKFHPNFSSLCSSVSRR